MRGRPKGSIKPKMMTDALVLALNRYAEGTKKKQLILVADALVQKAREGDIQAIREVYDRTEGRVPQGIQADLNHSGAITLGWEK